jgi:cell division transport system permease protein
MSLSFLRIIKFAWQDFIRNFWLSTVVIIVLILALSSVNALIGMNILSSKMLQMLQDKISVNIFLQEKISPAQLANFQNYLNGIKEINKVVYVSPEQGLAQFKDKHKNDPTLIDALSELDKNPLLPTLIISAKDTKNFSNLLAQIDSSDYASLIKDKNFEDHEQVINRINSFSEKARTVGLVLAAFFALISILLIYNAIRIIIYTHREEIAIMRLVGATNSFIRLPFIVESVFYGLFAVIITSGLCYCVCWFAAPYLNAFFGSVVPLFDYLKTNALQIVGVEVAGVIILNIVSSGLAVARYLKI